MGVTGLTVKLLVLMWMMAVQFDSAHGVDNCYFCIGTGSEVDLYLNPRNGISARASLWILNLFCKDFKKDTKYKFKVNCEHDLGMGKGDHVCLGSKDDKGSACIPRSKAGLGGFPAVGKCNDHGCTCDAELCNKSTPLVGPSRCMVMFLGACYFFWGLFSWGQTLI